MRSDSHGCRAAASLHWLVIAAVALGAAALARQSNAQRVEYSGSFQSATGRYLFTERTTSLSLFNGLSLDLGRLRLTAMVPVLYQNSTAVTFIAGSPVPTGGPDADVVRQRQGSTRVPMGSGGKGRTSIRGVMGMTAASLNEADAEVVAEPGEFEMNLGDPLVQAELDLYRGAGVVRAFTVSAVAKAPVADVASGIGTGEWDFGAGAMFALGGNRTFLLANAAYWLLGDMPELPLENTLSYGASVGRALGATGRWSVSGSVMGSTAVVETSDAPLSAGVGVGYLRDGGDGINVGVMFGLSESSPDVSTYVGWRVPLGGHKK